MLADSESDVEDDLIEEDEGNSNINVEVVKRDSIKEIFEDDSHVEKVCCSHISGSVGM